MYQPIGQELEEEKQTVVGCQKTLKFKAEMGTAPMAAGDAVENSLRFADLRASRLRDRVVELTHQIEELDTRENRGPNGPRYACWPRQWLGSDFAGFHQSNTEQQSSNEMDLSELLL